MNSFETDMIRALKSRGFLLGLGTMILVLCTAGYDSDAFRMCVPVVCTFPYTTAWIKESQNGFLKACLPRTTITAYILGKYVSCGIAGGLAEAGALFLVSLFQKNLKFMDCNPDLLFLSGCLWAMIAAVLAAWSNNRYLAYGGSFVLYYILVILHERYFPGLYCLYPYEWFHPTHEWVFQEQGVRLLLGMLILIFGFLYYGILRRCMKRG